MLKNQSITTDFLLCGSENNIKPPPMGARNEKAVALNKKIKLPMVKWECSIAQITERKFYAT